MSNSKPHPPTGTAWHQGDTLSAARRLRQGAKRNREAMEGKQALLETYQQLHLGDKKTISDLKRRIHLKKIQLENRGMMV